MLAWINSLLIVQIVSFAGIGGLLDSMFSAQRKAAIAGYILGKPGSQVREFEAATITGILELLSRPTNLDRLSIRRIFIFTIVVNLATTVIFDIRADGRLDNPLWVYAFALCLTPLMAFPLDFLSIAITKWLFYYKPVGSLRFFAMIVLDMALSTLPLLILMVLIARSWETPFFQSDFYIPLPMEQAFWFRPTILLNGAAGAFAGAIIINLVQLAVWISGSALRLLNVMMHKPLLAEPLERAPFTVLFLLCALVLALLDALGGA